jgi:hypothetical protein
MCIVVVGSEENTYFQTIFNVSSHHSRFHQHLLLDWHEAAANLRGSKLVFRFRKEISTMWTAFMHKLYKVCITGSPSASNNSLGAYNILFPIECSLSLSLNHKTQNFLSVYLRLWTRNFFQITGKKRIPFLHSIHAWFQILQLEFSTCCKQNVKPFLKHFDRQPSEITFSSTFM